MVNLYDIENRFNKDFHILDLENKQNISLLQKLLSSIDNSASKRILDILKGVCKSVLIEESYLDSEAVESYVAFYARAFKKYKRECMRLHFFSEKITLSNISGVTCNSKDLLEYNEESCNILQDIYLGFAIVRSSEPTTLGRTCIKALQKQHTDFILCETDSSINLAGIDLKLRNTPFMQQDARVSCCSTVALWTVAELMNQKFEKGHFSTSLITEMANKHSIAGGRALPTQGLTVKQIDWALIGMGYHPISYELGDDIKKGSTVQRIIYTYIESNLPVILAIKYAYGYHAITVLGHGYKINEHPKEAIPRFPFFSSAEWVPYFIIHDDQEGPYRYLKLEETKSDLFCSPIVMSDSSEFDSNNVNGNLFAIILPHPSGSIFTSGWDVELKVFNILDKTLSILAKSGQSINGLGGLVLRTYLMASNEFKHSLCSREGISPELISIYRSKALPKYIWVSEISTIDLQNQLKDSAHLTLGEILIDPTSTAQEKDFLTIHLPGLFIEMSPEISLREKDPSPALLDNQTMIVHDSPYLSLKRSL